jgi:hypothetical protein
MANKEWKDLSLKEKIGGIVVLLIIIGVIGSYFDGSGSSSDEEKEWLKKIVFNSCSCKISDNYLSEPKYYMGVQVSEGVKMGQKLLCSASVTNNNATNFQDGATIHWQRLSQTGIVLFEKTDILKEKLLKNTPVKWSFKEDTFESLLEDFNKATTTSCVITNLKPLK